ncbi:class I SAM-dependent methyltransferase [Ktedonosporobacter rubrisoli]|uniref:Class I SAM-dependent methyltransferase n=1 Tax=Ktedonosporobacter rubrisoli TaxID=2509675 RepID=A0A4P6K498_KTERU|nr:class I SAM-dependent methyltransferase [Ktedonosporobacter rubrisoli]QBD83128.1 class I SAM-dependent methyltransferase [Ktedonosporobacter rubrisoli]
MESFSPIDQAALRSGQQRTWASGDYSVIAGTFVLMSENLCEAVDVHANQEVLDVATGSGNTALAAARRWGRVTGLDYVPALLERGRERAAAEHLPVTFLAGDAQKLPFPAASFDIVLSTIGTMFAPDQDRVAAELLRVCRPGGKIGLANWTPDGLYGQIFHTIEAYIPAAAEVKSPALWGTEERVRELLGSGVSALHMTRRDFFWRYRSSQHWLEVFGNCFGPIVAALKALEPETRTRFTHDLIALVEQANRAQDGTLVAPAEYLEVVAIRK